MKYKFLPFVLFLPILVSAQSFPYQNKTLPAEERVKDLVSRLTLDEKLNLLGGTGFDSKPVERLGIPAIRMTDGPLGVRWGQATAFPAGIALASTWDTVLARKIGNALGKETLAKERDMLLGPCINIHRVPHGGRNFESFGEDPFLAGRLGVAWVKGVQQMGVLTSTKHFAVNNQEHERMTINVKVSERAMREIYWPAFETIVKEADTWTIMASYNRLNGPYATANNHLLNEVLKKEWGFRGFVVSDWGAVHGDLDVALGGTDLEMPTGEFLNKKNLEPYILSGKLPEAVVDDKITRLIRVMMISGLFDRVPGSLPSALNTKEHQDLARQAATESVVLLKNDHNLLPLDISKIKSVAVIGPNAATARTGGGGSSMVNPFFSVSPLDAFNEAGAGKFKVSYAPGATSAGDVKPVESRFFKNLKAEYFNNQKLEGTAVVSRSESQINFDWGDEIPAPGIGKDNYSVRFTGELLPPASGEYQIDGLSDDGIRVWINNKLIIDHWSDHGPETRSGKFTFQAGVAVPVKVEFYENGGSAVLKLGWMLPGSDFLAEAIKAAKESDIAVICVGSSYNVESEGFDRKEITLPEDQVNLIRSVSKVNPKTIVVLNSGAAVLMSDWISEVPAVLESWFPGQDAGHPVTDVLFGNHNPSGRLTTTFPQKWEDCNAYGHFPGSNEVNYEEGIYVGYRWFDTKGKAPLFPFGFGLSYTTFSYSDSKIESLGNSKFRVTLNVTNTGQRAGSEVVQLYVKPLNPPVDRPEKELKGFSKITLQPGETTTVSMELNQRSFSWYDEKTSAWVLSPGSYEVLIGSSSRQIKSKTVVKL